MQFPPVLVSRIFICRYQTLRISFFFFAEIFIDAEPLPCLNKSKKIIRTYHDLLPKRRNILDGIYE